MKASQINGMGLYFKTGRCSGKSLMVFEQVLRSIEEQGGKELKQQCLALISKIREKGAFIESFVCNRESYEFMSDADHWSLRILPPIPLRSCIVWCNFIPAALEVFQ